jgi:hypothetical protein
MSGLGWVRIVSWHSIRTFTRAGDVLTRCGRAVSSPLVRDGFPADEKTCESCLRSLAKEGTNA